MMKGLFIFPTLPSLQLDTYATLGFSPSFDLLKKLGSHASMQVDIRIFQDSDLIVEHLAKAKLSLNQYINLDIASLSAGVDPAKPSVVQAVCSVGDQNQHGYFAQEHQISYICMRNGATAYLLYDQLPMQIQGRIPSPIILLAPKIWVSKKINTYVVFANFLNLASYPRNMSPLYISILNLRGEVLAERTYSLNYNDVLVIDVKEFLGEKFPLSDSPQLLNMIGKGGQSSFAIYSIIKSTNPDSIAIEHSLAPSYFTSGNMSKIRNSALSNFMGDSL